MPLKEANQPCPFCREANKPKFIKDIKNKDGQFSLYHCPNCQGQYWAPFSHPGGEWYEKGDSYNVKNEFKPRHIHGYHEYFLKHHPQLTDQYILDLGCGTGEFLNETKKLGANVYGVDIDREAIKIAKHFFKFDHLYAQTIEDFLANPPHNQFDYITMFEVFEHTDNPIEIVRETKKLLKSEGLLIMSIPSRERIFVNLAGWDYPYHHLSRWSGKAIKKILELNDFNNIKISYINKFRQLRELFLDLLAAKLHFKSARKFKVESNPNNSPTKLSIKKLIIKIIYKIIRFIGVKLAPRVLATIFYPFLLIFYPQSGVMYIEANKK